MNAKTSRRRWVDVASVAVVCLAFGLPAAADEPPATPPTAPAKVDLELSTPFHSDVRLDLSPTQFVFEDVRLAAKTDLIGANVAQVDDVLRSHLGLGEGKGLVIASVADDGPAAKAGLKKNDVLITAGGEEIAGLEAFQKSLAAMAEKPITIGFVRAGKKLSVDVTVGSPVARVDEGDLVQFTVAKYWLGLGLAAADDTLRSQLAIAADNGLVVTSVEAESPAMKSGVMVNDLLLKLDGKALTTIESLSEQLQAIGDKAVSLELLRRGKPATLTVTPEQHAGSMGAAVRHFLVSSPGQFVDLDVAATDTNGLSIGFVNPDPNRLVLLNQPKPDFAKQVIDLMAQVKQLQASLEALHAAIETPQPAKSGEEKK